MRILHTADWHLGHTLSHVARTDEHAAFLRWLLGVLTDRDIDVLVIAGDIFDASSPPTTALRQWHEFLIAAWKASPTLQIVAVAGNHDSAARLESNVPLLRELGRLHIVGTPDPTEALVQVRGRNGESAWVVAVPFVRALDLPVGADLHTGVGQIYAQLVERARQLRAPGEAMIATGHCYLVGGQVSELSERRIQVGNQQALPADIFPADLEYVALGHLHRAQSLGPMRPVGQRLRYAGSPLPLAMNERVYRHEVTVITLQQGQLVDMESVRVPRAVDLVRIPESGTLDLSGAIAALRQLPAAQAVPPAQWPLLEVEVTLHQPEPNLRAQVLAAIEQKAARLVRLGSSWAGAGGVLANQADTVPQGLDQLRPTDVFARRWTQAHGSQPDDAHFSAFGQLLTWAEHVTDAEARRKQLRSETGAWLDGADGDALVDGGAA